MDAVERIGNVVQVAFLILCSVWGALAVAGGIDLLFEGREGWGFDVLPTRIETIGWENLSPSVVGALSLLCGTVLLLPALLALRSLFILIRDWPQSR